MPAPTIADQIGAAQADASAKVLAYADDLDAKASAAGADVSAFTGTLRGLAAAEPEETADVEPGRRGAPDLMAAADQAEAALTATLYTRTDAPADQVMLARDEVRMVLDSIPSGREAAGVASVQVRRLITEHGADSAVGSVLTSSWLRELAAGRGQPGLADIARAELAHSRAGTPAADAVAAFGDARAYALAAADVARQRIDSKRRAEAQQARPQPLPHELAARDAAAHRQRTGQR